jgi:hypothetical protein
VAPRPPQRRRLDQGRLAAASRRTARLCSHAVRSLPSMGGRNGASGPAGRNAHGRLAQTPSKEKYRRVTVLPHHPGVYGARVDAAHGGELLSEPPRVERRARSHDVDRLVRPAPTEELGEDVERAAHDHTDRRQCVALGHRRDFLESSHVLLEEIEARLSHLGMRTDSDDQNVLVFERIEAAPANLARFEQRTGLREVGRFTFGASLLRSQIVRRVTKPSRARPRAHETPTCPRRPPQYWACARCAIRRSGSWSVRDGRS